MSNHHWFARTLPTLLHPEKRSLELGAGSSELSVRLHSFEVAADGLDRDRHPPPSTWPANQLGLPPNFARSPIMITKPRRCLAPIIYPATTDVSIAAGFRADELPCSLGLSPSVW